MKDWKATPCVTRWLATKDDVARGNAAFYMPKADESRARPLEIDLPKLARFRDEEAGVTYTVVVIQAEECLDEPSPGVPEMDTLIGYRTAKGTFGVCSLREISWISETPSDSDNLD